MPVTRHIPITVLVIVLHQLGCGLVSSLPIGKTPSECISIQSAWAEAVPADMGELLSTESRTTPMPDQEMRTSPTGSAPADTSSRPETGGAESGLVDVVHSGISRGLLTSAGWLDSFFADERAIKEENQSYFFAQYNAFFERRTKPSYQPAYGLRLSLPQLQKKTRLVLTAEPPDYNRGDYQSSSATGAQVGENEERNVSAAIHYLQRATDRVSFIIRGGARIHNGRLEFFAGPRYRWLVHLKPWDFRFTQEVIYRTDTKWQTETVLDLERPLPYDLFFRTGIDGIWREDINGYFYRIGCTLRQPLDPAHAFQYEWVNSYQTSPVHELMETAFRIRYRQSVWRPWLFFELAPQIRFPRDRDFATTPGILFKFEMFFGRPVLS